MNNATPRRMAMVLAAAFLAIALLLAAVESSSAAPLDAEWSLFARANATSFVASNTADSTGYEIVSLSGVGPTQGLSTYRYGGADFVPPMDPVVTCAATVQLANLAIQVDGAYPYAGCVFFLGVHNVGSGVLHVNLGPLDSHATVTCNVSGCQASDVDIIAGGATPADADSVCRAFDGNVTNDAMTYSVPAGTTFVCPLFVTVLQPAKENAQYIVTITPPPVTGESPPVINQEPTQPPSPSVSPSPSPNVTEAVAGARTPGAPGTGSGKIIQRSRPGGGVAPAVILCFGLALICALFWAFPRKRNAAPERADDAADSELWRL